MAFRKIAVSLTSKNVLSLNSLASKVTLKIKFGSILVMKF